MLESGIVYQVAGLQIVQPIYDQVHTLCEPLDVGVVDVLDDPLYLDGRVHPSEVSFRCQGLGDLLPHVVLIEQHLPLEVVVLDEVSVHYPNVSHTRAYKLRCGDRAQSPAACHEDCALLEPFLPRFSNNWQGSLPRIPVDCCLHGSTSRYQGHDGDVVAIFQPRLRVLKETDVLLVDIKVQQISPLAVLATKPGLDAGISGLEAIHHLSYVGRFDLDLFLPICEPGQRQGYSYGYRHICLLVFLFDRKNG